MAMAGVQETHDPSQGYQALRTSDSSGGQVCPMAESALYREDVHEAGHCQVWGSFFDVSKQQWGYACRGILQRSQPCPSAAPANDLEELGGDIEIGSVKRLTAMLPRSSFAESEIFMLRWVDAALNEWRHCLSEPLRSVTADPRFGSRVQLEEAERALAPLKQLLKACSASYWKGEAVHVWSVGHNKWKDGKVLGVREQRGIADGRPPGSVLVSFSSTKEKARVSTKWVTPLQLKLQLRKAQKVDVSRENIDKLARIAELATEREYHAASQTYLELTVGHGKWHGDLSVKGMTGCAKAPRNGFKVKKDSADFLGTEEAKEYTMWIKRLVAFSQLVQPKSDVSKNMQT
eukprot:TRINITY_DN64661_c0_g1_i1.p1 TRINITY_DN64661_c0_g1~~TRINITY_DN64661_c0_g1_i1.p1  ORF type:complete len:347 (-),score=53.68 TRINITY_DN64661_c0_g1_i1:2-1042(-)